MARLCGTAGRAPASGKQAVRLPLVLGGHASLFLVGVCLAALSLWAGASAAAEDHAGKSQVSVTVQKASGKVCVRLKAAAPLGRHYLRATGRAGDVALRIPNCATRPVKIPVTAGPVRSVSAQPAGNDLVVTVERDAAAGYRSSYTRDRCEIVLEVDVPAATANAAETRTAPAVAVAREADTPAALVPRPVAPARPLAPSASPTAVAVPSPRRTPMPTPVLRDARVPRKVAMLPGTWRVYGAQERADKLVTLDFVSADIQDVLKALAIQSGANILVAPKVEGKVTVGLRNVTPDQALEYVVRLGSLAYGQEDGTYVVCTREQIKEIFPAGTRGRILFPPPSEEAAPGTPVQPAAPPKVVVVRLEKMAASAVVPVIQKLVPAVEIQTPDPKLVVLIGAQDQVSAAETAVRTLEAAVPAPPPAPAPDVPAGTNGVQQSAAPGPPEDFEIEVYSLRHVKAYDAGRLLKGFMSARILPEVVVVPAPAPAYPVSKEGAAKPGLRQQGIGDTGEALLNLLYGRAAEQNPAQPEGAAPGVAPMGPGQVPGAAPREDTGTVLIPEGSDTNTLLLIGPRPDIVKVKQYLDQLDVAPKQVMIDVKVTDVSLTDEQQLGVMWNWSTLGIQEIAPGGATTVPDLQLGRFGHAPVTFNATLEAMLKTQKARLLANPRIAVLDGRTASIHVGDTVRYLAQRTSGINGTTVSIGEENVGVVVNVAPRIGGDDVIVLDVKPKVNVITGFTPTGDGGQVPNTSERSVETVVRLRDGETLAIGGLIRDEDTVAMQRVPGLGDLPLLGELFKYRSRQRRNSEVLIFITPTIVPDAS